MSEGSAYPEAGFVRLAGNFMNAAKLVAKEDDRGVVGVHGFLPLLFPFLFLIGHALELAYKAVLLVDEATEDDLKRIGHDLVKCRQKVQACRPSLLRELEEPGTDEIVEMIGTFYKAKAFEYHSTGLYAGLPAAPNQVVKITARTVENIQVWLWPRVRQKIRDTRDGI